jgi:hypothetical protein
LTAENRDHLKRVAALITGFESPYGLELLATVDFLIEENKTFDPDVIMEKLWSERKKDMFHKQHVEMAIEHLLVFREDLYAGINE